MKTERLTMSLYDINENPDNPRVINDLQLMKLVKSLRELPDMLNIRPIVVNEDNIVLGGNMRLRALEKLNYIDNIPVIKVSGLTPEQEKEFLIKNNLSYGEWDWSNVVADYEPTTLGKWGLNVPAALFDDDEEPDFDEDELNTDNSIKMVTLKYAGDLYANMVDMLTGIQRREDLSSFTEVVEFLIQEEYEEN